jgi:CheY-like chemotaxis protein
MDIRIPKLDGYETTRRIKKIKKNLPVIAQTAYALEGEKAKCLEAGCDDYIAKPVKINELFRVIERHIL